MNIVNSVAEMRNNLKIAQEVYQQTRIASLLSVAELMATTGEIMTARELSNATGMSIAEISANLRPYRHCDITAALYEAGLKVTHTWSRVSRKFVELGPDGKPGNKVIIRWYSRTLYGFEKV